MAGLADSLREKSNATATAANSLLEAEDFETSAKKQSLFVIGQVNASMYATMADVLEQLELTARLQSMEGIQSRVASVLKRNDAIRRAAATGDWDEYNRLAAGGELDSSRTGADSGTASTTGSDGA